MFTFKKKDKDKSPQSTPRSKSESIEDRSLPSPPSKARNLTKKPRDPKQSQESLIETKIEKHKDKKQKSKKMEKSKHKSKKQSKNKNDNKDTEDIKKKTWSPSFIKKRKQGINSISSNKSSDNDKSSSKTNLNQTNIKSSSSNSSANSSENEISYDDNPKPKDNKTKISKKLENKTNAEKSNKKSKEQDKKNKNEIKKPKKEITPESSQKSSNNEKSDSRINLNQNTIKSSSANSSTKSSENEKSLADSTKQRIGTTNKISKKLENSDNKRKPDTKVISNKNNNVDKNLTPNVITRNTKPNTKKYIRLDSSSDEENILERKHSVHLPKLLPIETDFLQLVTDDNVEDVKTFLQNHPDLNVNCVNFQGVSALHIAIQNRNETMVEFLLEQPNIDIGDTVLHAVRDNHLKSLVMLLDAQKTISPGLEFAGATHSADFPDHVTPLILAAQHGHYEAVALLVSRGHTIHRPHPPNCPCADCKASLANDDPLDASSARLSIYRAIASPAYLVHVSSDPILSAFRLTAELSENAGAFRQFSASYLELKNEVSAFAVDLIGCCRTSEEVEMLLKQTFGSRGRRHFILPRLLMAVDYKQKEFVAHPNTQQVLESYWTGTWYSWRSKRTIVKALIVLSRVFVTPVILVMCMATPRSRLVQHWKIPLNKLITHAAAYFVFLAIIFYISNQDKSEELRGPPSTGAEPVLVLYVFGYIWSAIRLCVMQGPRRYFTELWNWGEIIMLLLFILTFSLWLAAAMDVRKNDKEDLERKYWKQYDPTLLAEGTFCLATICAYFRLMFLCQLNYHLGPLQVSLGKMTTDIYKYITIFAIIICSFAAGLSHFYQYYDGMVYEDEFGIKTEQVSSFTSLSDTLNTLFWALFCMAPLESADVIIENMKDPKHKEELENRHIYTERIGYFCFACFEVISVIIVLNMLIATMSNTFQRVTDNVAIEWTFGRTEVYVDYISQTMLPPPYNLIPTASGMASVIEWFQTMIKRPPGAYARWSPSYCCYIERDLEANLEKDYPALMSILVQRYFRDKESALVGGTGVEGELEALRREFITLKTSLEKHMK